MTFIYLALSFSILFSTSDAGELPVVKDYEQALAKAKQSDKPIFLLFTGLSCPHNEAIQKLIREDDSIRKLLAEDYVNTWLYVDDGRSLPKPEQVLWKGQPQTLSTYGHKWAHLEWELLQQDIQPIAAIVDADGMLLCEARTYEELRDGFLSYLECGLED